MRIAIADDHEVVRDGLKFLLAGVDEIEIVAEAENSHEAIEILLAEDSPDVMLLDLRMGGTSGFDVLDAATRSATATRIVVLTMHDDAAHVRQAMRMGATGYILKSAGRAEVLRALTLASAGNRYVQGDLADVLIDPDNDALRVTTREKEILLLIADGAENKQIARSLGISEDTVKSYLKSLFSRWEVTSRAEAVAAAIRNGVID